MLGSCSMRLTLVATLALLLCACGGNEEGGSLDKISRTPLSVRGWVLDVKGAVRAETFEQEIGRRQQLFQSTALWVENSPQSSGGIAENGAFIILDVPPGKAIVGFNAPGAENAQLILENVPGSADVFIPDVVLEPGGATVLDPSKITVRIASRVDAPRATGQTARIAGHNVPVMEAPLADFKDRRDYPTPPDVFPVARVR
jgi:hypothetical protein